jgi:hypothetical protein
MSITPGKTYKITNVQAGSVIDRYNGDNKSIVGWDWNTFPNQKAGYIRFWDRLDRDAYNLLQWILEQEPGCDGQWSLKSVKSGQYMGFEGEAKEAVHLVAVDTRQLWEIYPDDNDPATFKSVFPVNAICDHFLTFTDRLWVRGTLLVAELADANAKSGAPLRLWATNTEKKQVWKFEEGLLRSLWTTRVVSSLTFSL